MSEEKKPYLIINEEYDEIKINIKHTRPYMKLQQENQQLKENIGKVINYIDQVIGYKPCAREIDKELNTLVGILREIK